MKYLSISQIVLSVLMLVVLVLLLADKPAQAPNVLGGGNYAYNSTTTMDWNIGTSATAGGSKLLKTGSGVLRTVVINNETAGLINFYDATSTNHGDHATTTLFKVPASLAEGDYELNVAFSRGLLAEYQSSNVASSTVISE